MSRTLPAAAAAVAAALGSAQAAAAQPPACADPPAARAPAPEREIRIDTPDGRIAATLAGPADDPPAARALLLHGYTGARDEIPVAGGEGMFARAARAFAERGIASLRIDFLGSGASDGAWADTTFAGQARDAARARDALAAMAGGPGTPTGVLGYSQGGLVALRAAARAGGFDRVALWNPVLDPAETYAIVLGPATLAAGAAALAAGAAAEVPGARLRPGFFADLAAADPAADAAAAPVPVLIVTGARDPLAPRGAALGRRLASGRDAPTRILELDAGHDLGAVSDPALLDGVIACTAAFLLGVRPE